jgi:ligand-binding sensor domain-containing protein
VTGESTAVGFAHFTIFDTEMSYRKTKMILLRSFVFLALMLVQFNLPGRNIMFTSLGIADGLSQLTVHSIYQDETGAMWFGTRRGLNRFDGAKIQTIPIFPVPQGMSRQHVWNITGDRKGSVFIQVEDNLIRYDLKTQVFEILWEGGVELIIYRNDKLYTLINNQLYLFDPADRSRELITTLERRFAPVKQLVVSRQEMLWAATNAGLVKLGSSGQVDRVFFEGVRITALMEDANLTLWVGTYDQGVYRFNPHNETFTQIGNALDRNEIRCFEEDNNGDIWVGSFNGLFRINPYTRATDHYLPIEKMPHSLSHSSVYSLFKDQQGTIWAGTYFGGVNYFNPGRDAFRIFSPSSYYPDHISFPIVGSITEDGQGNIWICTEGGGLNKLDPRTGHIKVFRQNAASNSLSHNNLKSVWYEPVRNRLYLGTHTGGLSELDLATERFTVYRHNPVDHRSIPSNVVNKISGLNDELFLSTQRGLIRFNTVTSRFSTFFREDDADYARNYVQSTFVDSKGRIWLNYFSNELFRIDPANETRTIINPGLPQPEDAPPLRITQIFEDRSGRIFLIAEGFGIIQLNESDEVHAVFTADDGMLQSSLCFNLAQATSGRLIITSDKGITFLDPDKRLSRHLLVRTAIPLSGIIEENGLYVARNGEIFVGGTDGMVSFFEQDIEPVAADYSVYFNQLLVNNRLVVPGDETGILDSALYFTPQINLKHGQTNVIFGFTSSNYIRHMNHEYEYILEGFDKNWIPAQSQSITYTNISPGIYTLRVREKSPESVENQKEVSVLIDVAPAWYASRLAYATYFLLILGLLAGYIVFDRNRTVLKASLEFERKEKIRIEELNQSKLRFFTNISHEFRTPLTLIVSQADLIFQNPALPPAVLNRLRKSRNTPCGCGTW